MDAMRSESRFWRKVDRSAGRYGCWPWLGAITRGYGHVRVDKVLVKAHRRSYELLVRPIPPGMELDHVCRNRECVNPDHLEPVPHRVNTLRGVAPTASNARKTHCVHGHPFDEANTAILTQDGLPRRRCRTCARANDRRYREMSAPSRPMDKPTAVPVDEEVPEWMR